MTWGKFNRHIWGVFSRCSQLPPAVAEYRRRRDAAVPVRGRALVLGQFAERAQADVRDLITSRHELGPLTMLECRQFAELFLTTRGPAAMRTLDDPEFAAKLADTGGRFARLVPLLSATAAAAEAPAPADEASVPPIEVPQAVHPQVPWHRMSVFASFAGLLVVAGLIGAATYVHISTGAERTVIAAAGLHGAIVSAAARPAAAAEPSAAGSTIAAAGLQQVQALSVRVSSPPPDPANDAATQVTTQDMQGVVPAPPKAATPEAAADISTPAVAAEASPPPTPAPPEQAAVEPAPDNRLLSRHPLRLPMQPREAPLRLPQLNLRHRRKPLPPRGPRSRHHRQPRRAPNHLPLPPSRRPRARRRRRASPRRKSRSRSRRGRAPKHLPLPLSRRPQPKLRRRASPRRKCRSWSRRR